MVLDDWGEYREPRSLLQLQNRTQNLVRRLRLNAFAGNVAVPGSHPSEQHAQVVVDFRDGSNGRTGVPRCHLLRNRDRRSQPGNRIDIRLWHLPQKLPSVGRQRFHIPPLPFGVQRVKRQRALAGPTDSRHANQFVPRQRDTHVLQVMFPRAANDDF